MAPSPDPPPTAPASDKTPAVPRRSIWGAGWAKFSDNAIPSLVLGLFAGLMLFSLNENSGRMTRIEDRIARLDENQQEIALTQTTLVALFDRLEADIGARFAAVDIRFIGIEAEIEARFSKLEENQQEITEMLVRLVALFEAHNEGHG